MHCFSNQNNKLRKKNKTYLLYIKRTEYKIIRDYDYTYN